MGTLKVTCSRLGISLRRPRVKLLPPKTTGTARTVGAASETATFSICMKYKGQERNSPLPLTPNVINQLALEACFRDQEIGELAKDLLISVIEKGLFQELLGCPSHLSNDAGDRPCRALVDAVPVPVAVDGREVRQPRAGPGLKAM